jgi:hypothetical protein
MAGFWAQLAKSQHGFNNGKLLRAQFTDWLYTYKSTSTDAEGAAGKLATKRATVPQDGLWTPDATSKVSA